MADAINTMSVQEIRKLITLQENLKTTSSGQNMKCLKPSIIIIIIIIIISIRNNNKNNNVQDNFTLCEVWVYS
jgi:hypothetical protein